MVRSKNKLLEIALIIVFLFTLILFGKSNKIMAKDTEEKKVKIFSVQKGDFEEVNRVVKSKEEWKDALTAEQFSVTQEHGTERPFTGALLKNKEKGTYKCVACGTDLFLSETKYDSGTGWPSFWKPVAEENIGLTVDKSLFMKRVEVHCPRCGAHLGHVFEDGPPPTNKRYCINSASLTFQSIEEQ